MLSVTRVTIFLAAFVLALQAGADERKCIELDASCVCNEPLNTNQHSRGTAWGSGVFDPTDSSAAKSCGSVDVPSSTATPIAAGTISSVLPAGHSLSYVLQVAGGASGQIYGDSWSVAGPGKTMCGRSYRRWTPDSGIPSDGGDSQNQMKIITSGGFASWYEPWQISWGGGSRALGSQNIRFDTSFWPGGANLVSPASWAHAGLAGFRPDQNCINNFCRFEICVDWLADCTARARFRAVPVSPGSGIVYGAERTGAGANCNALNMSNNGLSLINFWSSGFSQKTQNSHAIQVNLSTLDTSYWPGAACEVEGGCSGSAPVPPPASIPSPPVLLSPQP
jgi:hypothetical protein